MPKKVIICKVCSGSGRISDWIHATNVDITVTAKMIPCDFCEGSGRVWELVKYKPYKGIEDEK